MATNVTNAVGWITAWTAKLGEKTKVLFDVQTTSDHSNFTVYGYVSDVINMQKFDLEVTSCKRKDKETLFGCELTSILELNQSSTYAIYLYVNDEFNVAGINPQYQRV